MDIKIIEKALEDYKRKKSVIETSLERIEVFRRALNSPETGPEKWDIFLYQSPTERMLRGPIQKGSDGSPVEWAYLQGEKRIERLKNWIKDEESKIYPLQVEVKQIEIALEALTKQQRYVIECKYFEKMFWRDIEKNFNETFRNQNYITFERLKSINKEALAILSEILEPYYNRFKIA